MFEWRALTPFDLRFINFYLMRVVNLLCYCCCCRCRIASTCIQVRKWLSACLNEAQKSKCGVHESRTRKKRDSNTTRMKTREQTSNWISWTKIRTTWKNEKTKWTYKTESQLNRNFFFRFAWRTTRQKQSTGDGVISTLVHLYCLVMLCIATNSNIFATVLYHF